MCMITTCMKPATKAGNEEIFGKMVLPHGKSRIPGLCMLMTRVRMKPGIVKTKAGEKEKRDRYQSNSVRQVWPVAHETWGRLGHEAELHLA